MLLGEVNLKPPEAREFFGDEDGDELHMLFDFVGMQAMYLALARGDAEPLRAALRDAPEIPSDSQWGRFVRNHDELTLDKLSEAEREEVFAAFGPDESLQLFGRGLRRRLPPMLDGDAAGDPDGLQPRVLAARHAGAVLRRGDRDGREPRDRGAPQRALADAVVGRAERRVLDRGRRASARAGRSSTTSASAPAAVNVARQRRDDDSLLNWFERLIRRRRECPEIGFGTLELLDAGAPSVLAHRCDWDGSTIVAVHELGGTAVDGDARARRAGGRRSAGRPVLGRRPRARRRHAWSSSSSRYGFRWLRVRRAGRRLPP